jgi:4-amino-4-deoxychorismate lyase
MTANPPDSLSHGPEFSLISSLRFDPGLPNAIHQHASKSYPEPHDSPYYLLRYHQARLLKGATGFQWQKTIECLQQPLQQFTQKLDSFIPDRSKAWRLRIVVDIEGHFSVDVHPATPWSLQGMFLPTSFDDLASLSSSFPWRLAIDTERTSPSQFTTYKTTSRNHYDVARKRVGIQSPMDPTEVLLVNPQGEVMEGSITTVYFRRRHGHHDHGDAAGKWITPPLGSGCMISASRQYALDYGFCTEQAIRVEELVDGEQCLLSNGVRGFIPAVLDLKTVQ